MNKPRSIVFLGVDGSGKSTFFNYFYKKNKLNYDKIHFVPDFFINKINVTEKNPHLKKK